MSTARDLALVAADPQDRTVVEQGDLSLALAGAELIDLLDAEALTLDGTLLVPAGPAPAGDPCCPRPRSGWRTADLARPWTTGSGDGAATSPGATAPSSRRKGSSSPSGGAVTRCGGSAPRRRPDGGPGRGERRSSGEPVLGALAAAVGLTGQGGEASDGLDDEQTTVLAAVLQAVTELAGERQRRTIEAAAFDNIWRGD